jgi:hypothetical protein
MQTRTFLLEMVSGTPLWAWCVLLVLLWAGWRQRVNRVVVLRRAVVISSALFLWSVSSVLMLSGWSLLSGACWLIAAGLAYVAGRRFLDFCHVDIMPDTGLVAMRGSYVPMAAFLLLFILHYVVGVSHATAMHVHDMTWFIVVFSCLSGVVSGLFLTRLLALWRLLRVDRT